jgi:hypothetical protein
MGANVLFQPDNDAKRARLQADAEPTNIERLKQFAWLLDNDSHPRTALRLSVFWGWAYEMSQFQSEADRTGKAGEYMQRGQVVRVLHPEIIKAA